MEFLVAVLKMGLLKNMGMLLSLVSPCCVMFYSMMMFHGVVIPHFQHQFFAMLNVYIQEQNKSVIIFTLLSTISLSVSICFD